MKRTPEIYRLKYSLRARWVLAGAIALFWLGCASPEQAKPPPPEVVVVQVEQKDVPIWKEWIGTLDGLVNAQIKPQVTGYLLRQTYTDGSFVKKGLLLFEIDPRTFQAALDQAKGQLANAEAQLATARANQVKAENDVNRYRPLAKEQAIPQQDLDNAIQANQAAQAQVEAAKAAVERLLVGGAGVRRVAGMRVNPDASELLGRPPLIDLLVEEIGYGGIVKANRHRRALLLDELYVGDEQQVAGRRHAEPADFGFPEVAQEQQLGHRRRSQPQRRQAGLPAAALVQPPASHLANHPRFPLS